MFHLKAKSISTYTHTSVLHFTQSATLNVQFFKPSRVKPSHIGFWRCYVSSKVPGTRFYVSIERHRSVWKLRRVENKIQYKKNWCYSFFSNSWYPNIRRILGKGRWDIGSRYVGCTLERHWSERHWRKIDYGTLRLVSKYKSSPSVLQHDQFSW